MMFEYWWQSVGGFAFGDHAKKAARTAWETAAAEERDAILGSVTPEMENAGISEARKQFGFGVTRASVHAIFIKMANAR